MQLLQRNLYLFHQLIDTVNFVIPHFLGMSNWLNMTQSIKTRILKCKNKQSSLIDKTYFG